ncbi:MAG: hypothetical protein ACMV0Y_08600 [Paludibacter sp.]
MKKIVLSALLMLAVCGSAFAHEMELNDYKVFGKLNNETTLRSLVRYLNADEEQHGQLKYIFQLTERKVNSAVEKGDEVSAENAMFFNLGNAKSVLSPEQYRKYLLVVNLTVAGKEELRVAEN